MRSVVKNCYALKIIWLELPIAGVVPGVLAATARPSQPLLASEYIVLPKHQSHFHAMARNQKPHNQRSACYDGEAAYRTSTEAGGRRRSQAWRTDGEDKGQTEMTVIQPDDEAVRGVGPALYTQTMPWTARLLEGAFAAAALLSLVAPRGIFIYLGLIAIALIIHAVANQEQTRQGSIMERVLELAAAPLAISVVVFLGYAALSAAWAMEPHHVLMKALLLTAVLALLFLVLARLADLTPFERWLAARGVVHGLAIGVAYMLIEHLTTGGIKAFLINETGLFPKNVTFNVIVDGRVVSINNTFLNRHMTALCLLLWPTLAVIGIWLKDRRPLHMTVSFALLIAVGVLAYWSRSDTSKLAYAVSVVAFLATHMSARLVMAGLAVAWTALTLAIIPAILVIFPPGAPYVEKLPASGQDRLAIWRHTIDETMKSPIVGTGADMTRYHYAAAEDKKPADSRPPAAGYEPRLSLHAHNNFLQVWFELGAIGAALLCAIGVMAVRAINQLPSRLTPFAAAFFTTAMLIALTGYGAWQVWLLAAIMLGTAVLQLANQSSDDTDPAMDRRGSLEAESHGKLQAPLQSEAPDAGGR